MLNTIAQDHAGSTQVHESDTCGVRSMRHLACVPTGKEEGLVRLQRVNYIDLLNICLLHVDSYFNICILIRC